MRTFLVAAVAIFAVATTSRVGHTDVGSPEHGAREGYGGERAGRAERPDRPTEKPASSSRGKSENRGSKDPGPAEKAGVKGAKVGERHGYDVRARPDGGRNKDGGFYGGIRIDF